MKTLIARLMLSTLLLSVLVAAPARAESFTFKPDDISLSLRHSGIVGKTLVVTIKGRSFDAGYGLGSNVRDAYEQLSSRLLSASLNGEVVTVNLSDLLDGPFIRGEGESPSSKPAGSVTPSQLVEQFHFSKSRGPASVSDAQNPKANVDAPGSGMSSAPASTGRQAYRSIR